MLTVTGILLQLYVMLSVLTFSQDIRLHRRWDLSREHSSPEIALKVIAFTTSC